MCARPGLESGTQTGLETHTRNFTVNTDRHFKLKLKLKQHKLSKRLRSEIDPVISRSFCRRERETS